MIRFRFALLLIGSLTAASVLLVVPPARDIAFALLFGWIGFLSDAAPRITIDWPSIAVSGTAAVFLLAGLHWLGSAYGGGRSALVPNGPAVQSRPAWRFRWTLSLFGLMFVMFAAGISLVGIVHQSAWLSGESHVLEVRSATSFGSERDKMRQILIGIDSYRDTHAALPAGGTFAPTGRGLHGWLTMVGPYLGLTMDEVDFNRPWTDPVNAQTFRKLNPMVLHPGYAVATWRDAEGFGQSHYAANQHVMGPDAPLRRAEFTPGTSNTLLLGQVGNSLSPWGSPWNWRDPLHGINQDPRGFGGAPGERGALFGMADGSVRYLRDDIDPQVMRALAGQGLRAAP